MGKLKDIRYYYMCSFGKVGMCCGSYKGSKCVKHNTSKSHCNPARCNKWPDVSGQMCMWLDICPPGMGQRPWDNGHFCNIARVKYMANTEQERKQK